MVADDQLGFDINSASRLTGTFKLRSGQVSDEYFDKYRFESDPVLLRRVAREMERLLPTNSQLLAGLELGGVPIATALSLSTGLPAVFVRKKPKEYGTCRAIEGRDVRGLTIAVIEDVITTGGAVREAATLLHQAGGIVAAVVCAIWRGDGLPKIDGLGNTPVYAALDKADLTTAPAKPGSTL